MSGLVVTYFRLPWTEALGSVMVVEVHYCYDWGDEHNRQEDARPDRTHGFPQNVRIGGIFVGRAFELLHE